MLLATTMLIALPSCQTTQEQGAAVGGIFAGVLCAALGGNAGDCAAIATAGMAVGYLAGAYVESEKNKYANLEDFYNAEITQSEQFNQNLIQYRELAKNEIAEMEAEVDQLLAQKKAGKLDMASLETRKSQIGALNTNLKAQLKSAQDEMKKREQVFADIRHNGTNYTAQAEQMQKQIALLKNNISTIETQTAQVASIGNRIQ